MIGRVFRRLAVAMVGVAVTLVAIEGGLRLLPAAPWAGKFSLGPWQWLRYEPILGWENIPGFHDDRFRIDAQGFRGDDVAPGAAAKRLRIVCLGDSRTFGMREAASGFRFDNAYPDALRAVISQRQGDACAMTLKARGYGPGDMTWEVKPGSTWRVTAERRGVRLAETVATADDRGPDTAFDQPGRLLEQEVFKNPEQRSHLLRRALPVARRKGVEREGANALLERGGNHTSHRLDAGAELSSLVTAERVKARMIPRPTACPQAVHSRAPAARPRCAPFRRRA